MSGFGRSFKFWGWYYAKTDALTALMIVAMVVFMAFVDGGNFMETFATLLPLYLGMMVVMEVIVFGFTSITVLFPFAVGFGAKRDTCMYAKTIFEHIVFMVNAAFAIAAFVWSKPEYKDYLVLAIPLLFAVMGLLLSAGNLVALFSGKFGRTAGMIVYIVFVVLCVAGSIAFISSDMIEPLLNTLLYSSFSVSVVLATVCILIDLLSAYLLYISVRNKDLIFCV